MRKERKKKNVYMYMSVLSKLYKNIFILFNIEKKLIFLMLYIHIKI